MIVGEGIGPLPNQKGSAMSEIIRINQDDYEAWIEKNEQGKFVLSVGDYVANVNEHIFTDLSSALARLAHIQKCAETEFDAGFCSDDETFSNEFATFINSPTITYRHSTHLETK
jgi:hypothetical protein